MAGVAACGVWVGWQGSAGKDMEASTEAGAGVSMRVEGLHQSVGVDSCESFLEGESEDLGFARVLQC